MQYQNPILKGCYPDPSICRVGETFYLACSSFHFFPGVPLWKSTDLLNWIQIGCALTRPSQLPLTCANSTGGIYAPTLRYHAGRFYLVTTNVTHGGNFFVYTDDIEGEWSEPIFVKQGGIDPSLFFEDGRTYFMSNGTDEHGVAGIMQCEIDPQTGEQLTDSRCIWQGTGGRFLESPHLYHIGAWYYLLASEGGTEYGHMVVYARGKTVYGPFTAYAQNPVLTNRNLGGYPLQGCGHADLVDDCARNWWMVHLCFRQLDRYVMHHVTGREVALVPVTFDADGWLTAGVQGTCRLQMETDRLPQSLTQARKTTFTFANTAVGREWCFLQNPQLERYRYTEAGVSLCGAAVSLSDETASPTWLGMRQTELRWSLRCALDVAAQEAGITLYMTATQHFDLCICPAGEGFVCKRRATLGGVVQEESVAIDHRKPLVLCITADPYQYRFALENGTQTISFGALETKYLSSEVAGNFTGVMLGLYAVQQSDVTASSFFHDFCLTLSESE